MLLRLNLYRLRRATSLFDGKTVIQIKRSRFSGWHIIANTSCCHCLSEHASLPYALLQDWVHQMQCDCSALCCRIG